jgi:hypothetical protein
MTADYRIAVSVARDFAGIRMGGGPRSYGCLLAEARVDGPEEGAGTPPLARRPELGHPVCFRLALAEAFVHGGTTRRGIHEVAAHGPGARVVDC